MITVEHQEGLTAVGVFGELTLADYREFEREVIAQLEAGRTLHLLIDLRGMMGYTLDVALEDARFARAHAHDVGRIAVLSDRDWVKWMALLSQLFVDAEIEVFDDEAAAREWLTEA